MSYIFGSAAYRSLSDMLDAIAERYLTSDGATSNADVVEIARGISPNKLARDAERDWDLTDHMIEHGYCQTELAAAFERVCARYVPA